MAGLPAQILLTILSVSWLCVMSTVAVRVLLVGIQMDSHTGELTGAAERLQDYGHELYLLVSNLYPKPERYEKRGFKVLKYHLPEDCETIASEKFTGF